MPAAQPVAVSFRHGHYEQPELVPSAHLPRLLTPEGRAQEIQGDEALAELWAMDALANELVVLPR